MSRTASKPEMEALHALIATKLSESISKMKPGEKGLAALINTARQFLKDNNIELLPGNGTPMGDLAAALNDMPFDPEADSLN